MSVNVTLYGNYLLVIGGASNQSLTAIGKTQFGTVAYIYSEFENIAVGASILFRLTDNQITISDGTINYFLITEDDIILIENSVVST